MPARGGLPCRFDARRVVIGGDHKLSMPASKGNDERVPAEKGCPNGKFLSFGRFRTASAVSMPSAMQSDVVTSASSVSFTQPLAAEQNLPTVNLTKLTIPPVRSIDLEALMHSAFEIFDGPFGALFVLVLCAAMLCL